MPTEHPHGPARRGRRDPQLAEELALDPSLLSDDDDQQPEQVFIYEGDIVACKITREVEIVPKHSSFFSYGVTTRVQPGESEEDVFIRVANTCHERVGQLVDADLEAYQAELEARRTTPIVHRG